MTIDRYLLNTAFEREDFSTEQLAVIQDKLDNNLATNLLMLLNPLLTVEQMKQIGTRKRIAIKLPAH